MRSKDMFGRPCFYVLLCSAEKLKLLLGAKAIVRDIQKYSQVIASGFGAVLPENIRDRLVKEYGCQFNA